MSILEQWLQESPQSARLFAEEKLILEATNALWASMKAKELTQTDIAQLLEVSKPHVSKVLSGHHNMTLRTLASLAYAMGKKVNLLLSDHSNTSLKLDLSVSKGIRFSGGPSIQGPINSLDKMAWITTKPAANETEYKNANESAAA